MKVGRNEPCPCGSGRKYKKCCLAAEEAAGSERRMASDPWLPAETTDGMEEDTPPPPPDPLKEARQAFWKRFAEADDEARPTLFSEILDDRELLNSQFAFDLLDLASEEADDSAGHASLVTLLENIQAHRPDVFVAKQGYFLDWWIPSVVALGREDDLARLSRHFAEIADGNIDLFIRHLDRLAFWGRLSLLTEALRIAMPRLKESDTITTWGMDHLVDMALTSEILEVLETEPAADRREAELRRRAAFYDVDAKLDVMAAILGRLSRDETQPLNPDDLANPVKDIEIQRLVDLAWDFFGHLKRTRAMPATRAMLAQDEIVAYLLRRHDGKLETADRPSRDRKKTLSHRRKPPENPAPRSPLCPGRTSLDRYAVGLFNFIFPRPYRGAALFEALPLWLDYLAFRGLINDSTRDRTWTEIRPLRDSVKVLCNRYSSDPALARMIEAW